MLDQIRKVQAAIAMLTVEQLAGLLLLTETEYAAGNITADQAEFVAALIMDSALERLDAQMRVEDGATLN
jgi:hypothetical protein